MAALLIFLAYCFGGMIWNNRAFWLYCNRVSKPYGDAIAAGDWVACDRWNQIARDFPLQDWDYVLNPYCWIRYWNWKPGGPDGR